MTGSRQFLQERRPIPGRTFSGALTCFVGSAAVSGSGPPAADLIKNENPGRNTGARNQVSVSPLQRISGQNVQKSKDAVLSQQLFQFASSTAIDCASKWSRPLVGTI